MRKAIIKFANYVVFLLQEDVFSGIINKEEMQKWIADLSKEHGFKDWYTIRKKAIQDSMSVGLTEKEYWLHIGRLMELKQMAAASVDYHKKKKYENEKRSKKK